MTTCPDASVIIPAFNAAKWLPEQLDALTRQTGTRRFEVIIADNGSTDETVDVARRYSAPYPVRIADAAGTHSASFARNVGANAAEADILLFCDADDLVNDLWVDSLTRAVLAGPGLIAAGALHHERFNDADVLHAYGIGPDPELTHIERSGRASYDLGEPFAGFLATAAGGNFGIRRSDYLRLGGMDPSFPGGSEETDFSWRAQLAGMEVISVPEAVVHYRLKSTSSALFRQQRIQQRARILLWLRYRDHGMSGPSVKVSVSSILAEAWAFLRSTRDRRVVLHAARVTGGHVGALEGMLRYRFLRRIP